MRAVQHSSAGLALLLVLVASCARAQEKDSRYGIAPDVKSYPQATPKEALGSVLRAAAGKKYDYLTAQLADPVFIDDRVKRIYGGKFAEQVADVRARLDPAAQKLLKRFLDEGKWTVGKSEAVASLADVKERVVRLVRRNDRWHLEHRSDPPEDK